MTRRQTGWRHHATYLTDHTPLSERQAEILALRKTGHSTEEIKETLTLYPETIEDHWDDVLEQWNQAQELCTIMGPHSWGDGETRQADDVDDTPWNLLSSAVMNYSDEERTQIELELYYGESFPMINMYLLVEREIVDTADHATNTTEHRSAHDTNALRGHIYSDVDSIDEYYLRWELLEKAGVDPGADYTPSAESQLGRPISQTEADAARERAQDRVDMHTAE